MSYTMLILAAGASERMGQPKALLSWKGKTLLEHAVLRVSDAGFLPLVVLGCKAGDLEKRLSRDTPFVVNPEWRNGLGSSIVYGVRHAMSEHSATAIGVSLVDQPLVTSEHLRSLGRLTDDVDCVATGYDSGAGVPAMFGKAAMELLLELGGDSGAKTLLNGSVLRVKRIEFSGTLDIDDAQAWKDFLENYD